MNETGDFLQLQFYISLAIIFVHFNIIELTKKTANLFISDSTVMVTPSFSSGQMTVSSAYFTFIYSEVYTVYIDLK